ncbi:MAG: tetraprenyl-beta-curcumene synthase [Bacilli bacterium]|nr:tetraprenyl-beta-curcumene synthase [Bacilli bacterium]
MLVFKLLYRSFYKVLPISQQKLAYWRKRAGQIPEAELRYQAEMSLASKQFHSDGGCVFAAFSKQPSEDLITAIVAFQTISDYLDNLCDRSTSLSAEDFTRLHESMINAVTLGISFPAADYYYEFHQEQEDGGYLNELVHRTRQSLNRLPGYPAVADLVILLTQLYCDLQVHKHVVQSERVPRLEAWYQRIAADPAIAAKLGIDLMQTDLYWWEFSAACGSTLGIFALWAEAVQANSLNDNTEIGRCYFPWITGLHILLDYWIDQEEDRLAGDLNFFAYYRSPQHAVERLEGFLQQARQRAKKTPNSPFHILLVEGLIGMYLSDQKVTAQPGYEHVQQLISSSTWMTKLMLRASRYYRRRTGHA